MTIEPSPADPITIVGAGLTGAACAARLVRAGRRVRVVERGRAVGGRMASPMLFGRRVDVGAGYFTVRDPEFADLVQDWGRAGLAREWTDTFAVLGTERTSSTGPMRWATPAGLRSLVRAVLGDIPVETGEPITTRPAGAIVLAMPDPQAQRLLPVPDAVPYEPVLAVALKFAGRSWPDFDAAFVNDDPALAFLADDGARRGDGAPVLVAHSTGDLARQMLLDPSPDAIARSAAEVVAAVRRLVDLPEPSQVHPHRWTFAKPSGTHANSYGLIEIDGALTGLAGDQWCPTGSPRVESAWRSGTDLAQALLERLE